MNKIIRNLSLAALCGGCLLFTSSGQAQGTAFTYQGRLNDGGNPATGNYDLTFAVFDAASDGNQMGTALTVAPTGVTNGLFTVTLDFGSGIFPGAARWLEIGVRTNGSSVAYALLSPRQPVTAAPYAITAGSAATAITAASVSGTISGSQIQSGTVTGSQLASGAAASNLNASGQSGGWATDHQHLLQ